MQSCPGCWAVYGEVLAREYSDPAYFQVHKLTVDAYAVQHPGHPSPQSIQSAAVHLIRLYLILETGLGTQRANDAIKAAADSRTYHWLMPPGSMGGKTVIDVHKAKDVNEHKQLVSAWAESAWAAWSSHHATVRTWRPVGF
jgi:Family of unknown function (DUF5946)